MNNDKKRNIKQNKYDLIFLSNFKDYFERNIFFENFELLNYVDSGSESIVYNCVHKRTKKIFISKIIFNKKRKYINKNELIISSRLKNKNIINFYFCSDIIKDESWCIVMERAKYGNLYNYRRNILKRLTLCESSLCYIAYQIINGLIYLHRCKIAHMDLKTKNVVIDEFLNVKTIDFSISIDYRGKNPCEKIKLPLLGTSLYMPLEVISSKKVKYKDLHKIDLYSFGVILYNLAFGKYPFNLLSEDEEDYNKIYKKIFINNIGIDKNNSKFSTYFLDFLNKLLEKDINKRINIIEAKNHFWIKGAKILLKLKENLNDINIFIYHILTDHIKEFNDYLGK